MSMEVWQAAVLGVIQGLSEFLPISSTGHLIIGERLMGISSTGLLLEILLHVGTLAAVLTVFWRDIFNILRHPIKDKRLLMLVIATIPAVAATLLFKEQLEAIFDADWFLGFSFLLTAAFLLIGEAIFSKRESALRQEKKAARRRKTADDIAYKHAIAMGVMQSIAILPGVSRSGATIVGGVSTGLTRESAAKFSFLMSAIAILGSLVFKIKDLLIYLGYISEGPTGGILQEAGETVFQTGWEAPAAGVLAAAVTGYLAIRFMLKLLRTKSLKPFAVYVTIIGVLILIDQLFVGKFFSPLF